MLVNLTGLAQNENFCESNCTIVDSLKKGEYKKVLVVAGAGVSVSAGIPDVSALLGMFCCIKIAK